MNTHAALIADFGGFSGLLAVLGALAAAAMVLGVIWLRHRTIHRRVNTRFAEFKDHVIHLRERVETVEQRHKLLPGSDKDFQGSMAGETLALYNQTHADVRRLWDDWLRRMDIWEQVQVLIATSRGLGVRRLKEADRLLDQLGSFDDVDRACQGCVGHLDQLEHGHERAQEMLGQAETQPGRLREPMESVARLPLPTAPYEAELTACAALTEQSRQLLKADPIGAQGILTQCLERLADLDRRLKAVVRLFHEAHEAGSTLDQVAHLAAERRAGGLLLTEPEGDPDPLLEEGRTHQLSALQTLERGETEAATAALKQTLALAEQAKIVIERQAAARQRCAAEIPARRSEAERLQQATAAAQSQRSELHRDFAPESWHRVTDNLAHAQERLGLAGNMLEEAALASAERVQHYFRACGLLDQVRQYEQQAGSELLEIGRCLQELTAMRKECSLRRRELLDQAGKVRAFVAMHSAAVRQPAQAKLEAVEGRWRSLCGQTESPRPDWPTVRQQMEELRKEFAAAFQEAEEDVRRQQQLVARLSETSREADRVGEFLRQHREDRQQANERYRSAVETLAQVRRESSGKPDDWMLLLQQVEDAAATLKKTEELARQDLQLADRAAAEIDAADRELERARGFVQLGISADVTQADHLLAQARLRLAEQAYEQAIDLAGGGQRAARQAYDDASHRVQQEQQRQDAERRRLEAAESARYASPSSPATDTGLPGGPGSSQPLRSPVERELDETEPPDESGRVVC